MRNATKLLYFFEQYAVNYNINVFYNPSGRNQILFINEHKLHKKNIALLLQLKDIEQVAIYFNSGQIQF